MDLPNPTTLKALTFMNLTMSINITLNTFITMMTITTAQPMNSHASCLNLSRTLPPRLTCMQTFCLNHKSTHTRA